MNMQAQPDETENKDHLLLKWGTLKGWNFRTTECEAFVLLKEYSENSPLGCMSDYPNDERKKLLCKIIDKLDGDIQNDWTGEFMTKEEAKDYVMNYGEEN